MDYSTDKKISAFFIGRIRSIGANERNDIYMCFPEHRYMNIGAFSLGLLAVSLLIAMLLAPGCLQDSSAANESGTGWQGGGNAGTGGLGDIDAAVSSYPVGVLTAEEEADILYLREEEKLAHDVYLVLYDRWDEPVFANIANAEVTHMDNMLVLIGRYGLTDPSTGAAGTFTNATLQAAYDDLTEQGSVSKPEAYRTGAYIEELDIGDLRATLNRTDKQDLTLVYERLMDGSSNHLRAFASHLDASGESYTPVILSQEEYDRIISGT